MAKRKKPSHVEMLSTMPAGIGAPDDNAEPILDVLPEPIPTIPEPTYETTYLPLESLVPNAWNPQTMDPEQFNRLVDEISEVGFIDPIQVVPIEDGTYRIIGGEHRWKAAKVAGLTKVPCFILSGAQWADSDLQKFVTVRLNVIHGRVDPEKFIGLYNEMTEKYGSESIQRLMGYSDEKAFGKLVEGVQKGMRRALPKELQGEFDNAAKQVKTIEDLSKVIQTMFTRYGDTVNQSFMVFTHGTKNHIYVAMSPTMKKAMDKVIEYCRKSGEDINDFMEPLTKAYMQTADARLKRMSEGEDQNSDEPVDDA